LVKRSVRKSRKKSILQRWGLPYQQGLMFPKVMLQDNVIIIIMEVDIIWVDMEVDTIGLLNAPIVTPIVHLMVHIVRISAGIAGVVLGFIDV